MPWGTTVPFTPRRDCSILWLSSTWGRADRHSLLTQTESGAFCFGLRIKHRTPPWLVCRFGIASALDTSAGHPRRVTAGIRSAIISACTGAPDFRGDGRSSRSTSTVSPARRTRSRATTLPLSYPLPCRCVWVTALSGSRLRSL